MSNVAQEGDPRNETRRIWKYELEIESGPQTLLLPVVCDVLHVGAQGAYVYVWALVDPLAELRVRTFEVYGTGWEIHRSAGLRHLGTVQIGEFVWHVFERIGGK